MKTFNDQVSEVISSFLKDNKLFTALDISNQVKKDLPFATHRQVRDEVRNLFSTQIETAGYTKSNINVNLKDGSTALAVLYHPFSDSWDLDAKYDAQMRNQTAINVKVQPVNNPVVVIAPTVSPIAAQNFAAATISNPVVPAKTNCFKDLWENLFNSKPSLFPRK